jgi:hypothetical protein
LRAEDWLKEVRHVVLARRMGLVVDDGHDGRFLGGRRLAVVAVVRAAGPSPRSDESRRRAEDILAERYAHGEIDADGYQQRLDDLNATRR